MLISFQIKDHKESKKESMKMNVLPIFHQEYEIYETAGHLSCIVNKINATVIEIKPYITPCTRLDLKPWFRGYVPNQMTPAFPMATDWKGGSIHGPGVMNFKTLRVQSSARTCKMLSLWK